ncbi:uncharacterized protein JN550_008024 [Neoarthrinium moseri]|uniref:uncharacterized protein n=1 Tax=Neoarthrinium moseri TaxID=1658444 RepID=UPI001FDE0A8C|nr:uncharacterized protein JN550_008024 [Neoarthrinium moseri]KAI1866046.1 hypothetical protein JN550_008024 [Neoarthrinium moseri]
MNLYIIVLPLPILFKLHLVVSKRLQLIAVFATAIASRGVVASIVDLVYCVELLDLEDGTWREACVSITTIFETDVPIIVGSMPFFSTFLKLHVAQSDSVQALLPRFSNKRQDASTFPSDPPAPPRTFESSEPKMHPYYKLSESALLKSRCTASGDVLPTMNNSENTIMRMVGIFQQTHAQPRQSPV